MSVNPNPGSPASIEDRWEKFPVDQWRRAVFVVNGFFKDLYTSLVRSTEEIVQRRLKATGKASIKVRLIEIGSGTGEYISAAATRITGRAIGVEFNSKFVNHCKSTYKKVENLSFVLGDAQNLGEVLESAGEYPQEDEYVIFACVNNTLGIMPDDVRQNVLKEVSRLLQLFAGRSTFLIGYFDGEHFGAGVQYFYGRNPTLCGSLVGADIDVENQVIKTKDGYVSRWMTAARAYDTLGAFGLTCVRSESRDNGVIIEANRSTLIPKNPQTVDDTSRTAQHIRLQAGVLDGISFSGLYDEISLTTVANNDQELLNNATDRMVEWLSDVVNLRAGSSVLELGGGFGRCGVFLAKFRECSVVSIDDNGLRCDFANERVVRAGASHRMHVVCSPTPTSTPLPMAFTHVVALDQPISFLGDQTESILTEAGRTLRQGGVAAISLVTRSANAKPNLGMQNLLTSVEVQQLAIKYGLTPVSYLPLTQHLTSHCTVVLRMLSAVSEEACRAIRVDNETVSEASATFRAALDATQCGDVEFGVFLLQKA